MTNLSTKTPLFGDIVTNRHAYAKDWKARTSNKILGCFCTYVPEELVYAAGILPVRILGGHDGLLHKGHQAPGHAENGRMAYGNVQVRGLLLYREVQQFLCERCLCHWYNA